VDIDRIIRQAKRGDIESFEILYKRYRDMIFNYIIRLGISPEDAEEICDDVFLHVYQNLGVFRSNSEEEK
jgi:RNA polymerase sigma-70 factor (ECF subfamily)